MPTIVTHALLPLIAASAAPQLRPSGRLVAAGMIAAMLPDADLVSRVFGIPHAHDFGHRGASHTLLFALLVGAIAARLAPTLAASRRSAFWFLFASTLSHPLTDMLTDGGKGIMIFWPLVDDRLKWPMQPIEVSPIGLRAVETGAITDILLSELVWLVLPALLLAVLCRLWCRPHIDLAKGQS